MVKLIFSSATIFSGMQQFYIIKNCYIAKTIFWCAAIFFYYKIATWQKIRPICNRKFCVHSGTCKSGLHQKCPYIKKSTILIQLLWNFVKIRYTCLPPFSKVSLWLGKNCRFFNKRTFLVESGFACYRV